MRVLHIVPTYVPAYRYGGPIESVHTLNKALYDCNVDVTVYTTNLNGGSVLDVPLSTERWIDGVRVYYFPITFRPWEYSYAMHKKLTELRKGDFDLMHITSVFLSASTLGAFYARKNNVPYIISPRGSLMRIPLERKSSLNKRIYLNLIEKINLKNAAAIHFTSEQEKKEYQEMGLPLFQKSIVITNPWAPLNTYSLFKDSYKEASAGFQTKFDKIPKYVPIILFLSRINWKKGLDTLIPAWRLVLDKIPDAYLVIAGPDEKGYLSEVKKMMEQEKIRENIVFTGTLTGPDKTAAFERADIFVLPSYSENFGMAVAEAMYFKKPVIITPQVAISDMIKKAGAGLVVPKTANAFAEAIIKLIQNKNLREQMGERGRGLVMREFSPGAVSEKMLQIYNELIQKS